MDTGLIGLPVELLTAAQPPPPLSAPLIATSRMDPHQTSRIPPPKSDFEVPLIVDDASVSYANSLNDSKSDRGSAASFRGDDDEDDDALYEHSGLRARAGGRTDAAAGLTFQPDLIVFTGYDRGEVHTRRVKLTNAAFSSQRMQVALLCALPGVSLFELSGDNPGVLAPGASCTYTISFRPPEDDRLITLKHSTMLRVITECGSVDIPVQANPAPQTLSVPSLLDFGTVAVLDKVEKTLRLHNPGCVPLDAVIQVLQNGRPEFTIRSFDEDAVAGDSLYVRLPARGNYACTVAFCPIKLVTSSVDVLVRCRVPSESMPVEPEEHWHAVISTAPLPPVPARIALLGSTKPGTTEDYPQQQASTSGTGLRPTKPYGLSPTFRKDPGQLVQREKLQRFKQTQVERLKATLQERIHSSEGGSSGRETASATRFARDTAPFDRAAFTAHQGYNIPGNLSSHGTVAFLLTQQQAAPGQPRRLKPQELAAAIAAKRKQAALLESVKLATAQAANEALNTTNAGQATASNLAFGMATSAVSQLTSPRAATMSNNGGCTAFSKSMSSIALLSTLWKTSWAYPLLMTVAQDFRGELQLFPFPLHDVNVASERCNAVISALKSRSPAGTVETGTILDVLVQTCVAAATANGEFTALAKHLRTLLRRAAELIGVKCDRDFTAGVDSGTYNKLMFDYVMQDIKKEEDQRVYTSTPVRGEIPLPNEVVEGLQRVKTEISELERCIIVCVRSLHTQTVALGPRGSQQQLSELAALISSIAGLNDGVFPPTASAIPLLDSEATTAATPATAAAVYARWSEVSRPVFDLSKGLDWSVKKDALNAFKLLLERKAIHIRLAQRLSKFQASAASVSAVNDDSSVEGGSGKALISLLGKLSERSSVLGAAAGLLVPESQYSHAATLPWARALASDMAEVVPTGSVSLLPLFPDAVTGGGINSSFATTTFPMIAKGESVIPGLSSAVTTTKQDVSIDRISLAADFPAVAVDFVEHTTFETNFDGDDVIGAHAWKTAVTPGMTGLGPVKVPILPWECPQPYTEQPLREYRLDEGNSCGPTVFPLPQAQFHGPDVDERLYAAMKKIEDAIAHPPCPLKAMVEFTPRIIPVASVAGAGNGFMVSFPSAGVQAAQCIALPPGMIQANVGYWQMPSLVAASAGSGGVTGKGKDAKGNAANTDANTTLVQEKDAMGNPLVVRSSTFFAYNLPLGPNGLPLEFNPLYHLDPAVNLRIPFVSLPPPPPSHVYPAVFRFDQLLRMLPPALSAAVRKGELPVSPPQTQQTSRTKTSSTLRPASTQTYTQPSRQASMRNSSVIGFREDAAAAVDEEVALPTHFSFDTQDEAMDVNGMYWSLGDRMAVVPGFATLQAEEKPSAGGRRVARDNIPVEFSFHFHPPASRAAINPADILVKDTSSSEGRLADDVLPYDKRAFRLADGDNGEKRGWNPAWRRLLSSTVQFPALLGAPQAQHMQSDDSESEPEDAFSSKRAESPSINLDAFIHPSIKHTINTDFSPTSTTVADRAHQHFVKVNQDIQADDTSYLKDFFMAPKAAFSDVFSFSSEGLPTDSGSISDAQTNPKHRFQM